MSIIDTLITDRTQADAAQAAEYNRRGYANLSDSEKAAWDAGLKGAYNATDLNRVGNAVAYIRDTLVSLGYAVTVSPRADWTREELPTPTTGAAYLGTVQTIRNAISVMEATPTLPADVDRLTWSEANDIEQILVDVNFLVENMQKSFVYCGQPYSGMIWSQFGG